MIRRKLEALIAIMYSTYVFLAIKGLSRNPSYAMIILKLSMLIPITILLILYIKEKNVKVTISKALIHVNQVFIITIPLILIAYFLFYTEYSKIICNISPFYGLSLRENLIIALMLIIIAPVAEELIFRGYFLLFLKRLKLHKTLILILISAGFMALHFQFHIVTFTLGVILTYRRLHGSSMLELIFTHSIFNLIVIVLSALPFRSQAGDLIALICMIVYILTMIIVFRISQRKLSQRRNLQV